MWRRLEPQLVANSGPRSLRSVSRLPDDELTGPLGRLVASELVFQRGVPPDAIYTFKHALIQDAAHGSLLAAPGSNCMRRSLKRSKLISPELMDTQPDLLAQHYAEAGLIEKSVAYWSKAGHRSAARSAMAEAATRFHKALDQLALLPDEPKNQTTELELSSALGAVLIAVKGNAAPETGQAYARARELWEQLGSPSEFLQLPYGLFLLHAARGELDLALRLDQDLLRLSQERNNSGGLVLGTCRRSEPVLQW